MNNINITKSVPVFLSILLIGFFSVVSLGSYMEVSESRDNVNALTSTVRMELPNATYTKDTGLTDTNLHSVNNNVSTAYTLITNVGGNTTEKPKFNGGTVIVYAVKNVQNSDEKTVYSSQKAVNFALRTQKDRLNSARHMLIGAMVALVLVLIVFVVTLLI